ncbi:MAG: autotransporter outer membrane beta-barrel domain-containing protein [Hyphomicrobiales bacterium]
MASTALASTLILGAIGAPSSASAQIAVFRPASPVSVNITNRNNCIFPGTCALIRTILPGKSINFTNTGDFATAGLLASGIYTQTLFGSSPIDINNSGNIATAGLGAVGIQAITFGNGSPIDIINTGDVATIGVSAYGIYGYSSGQNSNIAITNRGRVATRGAFAAGIASFSLGLNSDIQITNSGDLATRGFEAEGIDAGTYAPDNNLTIVNRGNITTRGRLAEGIYAFTLGPSSDIHIVNSGDITTKGLFSAGIYGGTFSPGSSLKIENSGHVTTEGAQGFGIYAQTFGFASPIIIENSGSIHGTTAGIYTYSATSTKIMNSGDISARSGLAIDTTGAGSRIYNSGLITGFIDLTSRHDLFVNRNGGVFDAKRKSNFRGGSDAFINQQGATLRTATRPTANETTSFVNLERFSNHGLINMVDEQAGDTFQISNTVGGTDLNFDGGSNSELAVDTFLGGPGSKSDHFVIEGNTTGRTLLHVNNTNTGSARFNPVPIPVIFVEGNVKKNAFYLEKPIDAGFFDYDLFFRPTGSGIFELKNHPGGGSHILPHLVTVTHDTFHNTTETWFDQSTDLRVLLARGSMCSDGQARAQDDVRCQQLYNFTPGVWVRGAGAWFDLQDNAKTTANGRTYKYDLERNLDIWLVESGIDLGKRDLFADGDILVFGVLGGAVESSLDYKSLVRTFTLRGGEAGAYATYLNGGLFVDTLFKAIFGKLDPHDVPGFPNKLDNNTYGFRTDTGYRFGGMRWGPFFEPLATIAVSWNDIDDFAQDGNGINFKNDEDVRGRVGLRVGTSSEVWEGTTMEPFVIGSLWGNFSGTHNATLTSGSNMYEFIDEPEDVWGVVSAGVNFFNPGAQTAVFAKLDYTFADQTQGIGVKAGMRYNW